MKFVVMRSNLRDAISSVERATGDVQNLPILKNVLIRVGSGEIIIVATNLEIAVTATVSGKIIQDGEITVPLALFSELIANLQSDRLNVEARENILEVKTDNYTATINGMPTDDFPSAPKAKDPNSWIGMKGVILKDALQQVVGAAVASDLRPEFNSVLFDFSLETLKLTATDGFRIAEKSIAGSFMQVNECEPFKMLVPLKTAQEVSRVIGNADEVRIYPESSQVVFKTTHMELISRVIDGNFPEYSQLIPKKLSVEVSVSREELINAVKIASVFSKNREVTISIHDDGKTIEVRSADQTLGENKYLLTAKIKGGAMDVIFNARYFIDALKVISTEDVFLGFQEDTNPAIIKSTSDASYFYILKPLMNG